MMVVIIIIDVDWFLVRFMNYLLIDGGMLFMFQVFCGDGNGWGDDDVGKC